MKNLPAPTAKDINDAHRLARSSAETAVQHAIKCGQLLTRKKAALKHGEFEKWVAQNCEFAESTARKYMKAAGQNATSVAFSTLQSLFPSGTKPKSLPAAKAEPATSARSVKGAVMNPPESAAQGSEAGNRNKPSGVLSEQVRPPAPEPDPEAPERPDDVDEDAALASAEADYQRRVDTVMGSDEKLVAAMAQIKQQSALIGTLETTRDGYMRGKEAVTQLLKAEQRKTAKLEKELARAHEENERLRERIALMEEAA